MWKNKNDRMNECDWLQVNEFDRMNVGIWMCKRMRR